MYIYNVKGLLDQKVSHAAQGCLERKNPSIENTEFDPSEVVELDLKRPRNVGFAAKKKEKRGKSRKPSLDV